MERTNHRNKQLSAEQLFELRQNRDDANKAVSLASWSYIGLIVPLIGWILAGYSLSLSSGLPRIGIIGRKVRSARRNAGISIVLSILIVIFWTGIYVFGVREAHKQDLQKEQAQQQAQKDQEQSQQFQQQIKQTTLDNCLKQADDNYTNYVKLNGTHVKDDPVQGPVYTMPQTNWDYVERQKNSEKDECYRRSSAF